MLRLRASPRYWPAGAAVFLVAVVAGILGLRLATTGGQAEDGDSSGDMTVVAAGDWGDASWRLEARHVRRRTICFSISNVTNGSAEAVSSACGELAETDQSGETDARPILYLAGTRSPGSGFPAFIVGAVIDTAEQVLLQLSDGRKIRTAAFEPDTTLGMPVRFFATSIGGSIDLPFPVSRIAAYSANGAVVACFSLEHPATATLSDCKGL